MSERRPMSEEAKNQLGDLVHELAPDIGAMLGKVFVAGYEAALADGLGGREEKS